MASFTLGPWVPDCGSAPWRLQAVATCAIHGPCHTWNHPQPSSMDGFFMGSCRVPRIAGLVLLGKSEAETMVFTIKYRVFRLKFSHHPILWINHSGGAMKLWHKSSQTGVYPVPPVLLRILYCASHPLLHNRVQCIGSFQRPNPEFAREQVLFFDGQFCVWFFQTHEHPGRGRT